MSTISKFVIPILLLLCIQLVKSASRMDDEEVKKELDKIFRKIDPEAKGVFTPQEYQNALRYLVLGLDHKVSTITY